jgi:serine/threonine protein kinase
MENITTEEKETKLPDQNLSSENSQKVEEVKIKNQYSFKSTDRLGGGSFGQIYKGINLKTKEEVAIKIESKNIETPQLLHESKILKILKENEGFPKVYLITPLDDVLIMVMELLGDNLQKLIKNQKEKKFSLKTTLMLGIQILKRIQTLHENNFIHRDIKPENFTIGLKKMNNTIYMIDYGLTRKYCDSHKNHIPYKEGKNLTGTALYASIYTHKGIEQSRRDDLESLGYMMVYFCKGELPWMDVKAKNKAGKYKKIMEKKIEMKPEILCNGLINEFMAYFKYVRELQFTEEPNYNYLLGLLNNAMKKNNIKNDFKFDWCTNSNDSKNNNEKFISTESLFSKLKLGGLNFNVGNGNKDNNDKKDNTDINILNEKEKNEKKECIDINNKNINENSINDNNIEDKLKNNINNENNKEK